MDTQSPISALGAELLSWQEDRERLVLYADFMGFKSRVFSKTHKELKKN
jgi:hypothetical protein